MKNSVSFFVGLLIFFCSFSCSDKSIEGELECWERLAHREELYEKGIEKAKKVIAEEEASFRRFPEHEGNYLRWWMLEVIRDSEEYLEWIKKEKIRLVLPYIGFLAGTPYYGEILEKT